MSESELLNHFQCDIQCMTSNSGNDNTNIKLILYNVKLIIAFFYYFENKFQECGSYETVNFDVVLAVAKSNEVC